MTDRPEAGKGETARRVLADLRGCRCVMRPLRIGDLTTLRRDTSFCKKHNGGNHE